jgi:putative PEP-CTERM system histidine kinase
MASFMVDLGTVAAVLAGLAGCAAVVRTGRPSWVRILGLPYAFFAALMIAVSLFVRSPFSPLRVRLVVTALCLAPAPWLLSVLALSAQSLAAALARWRALLIVQTLASVAAAALMWAYGVDWITGIGPEPAVVLSRWGLAAIGISAVPGCAALVILARRFGADAAAIPGLWASAVGAICSLLWISAVLLWRGYFSLSLLQSASALGGVSAAVGAVAILQTLSASAPFAPSRRLIYGASAASLVAAYLIVARFALGWVMDVAAAALPEVLPVAAFAVGGGLVVTLGSQRGRHRLWVAVGRHLFRSKHDYGETWIHLTKLVAAARDPSDLTQHAAAFCRRLLCVPEVSVWLVNSSGRLTCAAVATAEEPSAAETSRGTRESTGTEACAPLLAASSALTGGGEDARLAQLIGASFACPMRVDGHDLGFIAVGSRQQQAKLDEEDRQVVQHVAAELASALALHQLAEEIADARQIDSFHRVTTFVLHDLKNLVAQQSFVLENAARFRNDPTFVSDALAAFEDSTSRMRTLIGRLRRSEPGVPLPDSPCDLLEVLRAVIALPRIALAGRCKVEVSAPEGVQTCPLLIDREALTEVFTNLLINAVESLGPDAGEVGVRVARVADRWRIDVRDNGRGMPETFVRDHLFRPFRTTKEAGLGIGLFHCKTIVEAAGGSITVSSVENVGTTVSVTLPAQQVRESQAAADFGVQHGKTDSARC